MSVIVEARPPKQDEIPSAMRDAIAAGRGLFQLRAVYTRSIVKRKSRKQGTYVDAFVETDVVSLRWAGGQRGGGFAVWRDRKWDHGWHVDPSGFHRIQASDLVSVLSGAPWLVVLGARLGRQAWRRYEADLRARAGFQVASLRGMMWIKDRAAWDERRRLAEQQTQEAAPAGWAGGVMHGG